MVKKKDVTLVNICFRELLILIKGKQIYLALKKGRQNLLGTVLLLPTIPDL